MPGRNGALQVYGSPDGTPERVDERRHRRPHDRRIRDVDEHQPPRELRTVLDLTDDHLDREYPEHDQRAAHVTAPRANEPQEQQRKGDPEDGSRTDMPVHGDRKSTRLNSSH